MEVQPLVVPRSVPQTSKPRPARPRHLAWKYALRVPSWSTAELPDGDACVFYQMEVTVLPPGAPPRKRSVGRRYSNFLTLFAKLQEELGMAALTGLEPPPKHSLMAVNRHRELVEQRRWELERWLWRLTEVPRIANSHAMYSFCELDTAARAVGSNRIDPLHEISAPREAASGATSLPVSTPPPGRLSPRSLSGRSNDIPGIDASLGTRQGSGTASQLTGRSSPSSRSPRRHSGPKTPSQELRLTLHLEERTRLRRMVDSLAKSLAAAQEDLHDAARSIQADQAVIAMLASQVESTAECSKKRDAGTMTEHEEDVEWAMKNDQRDDQAAMLVETQRLLEEETAKAARREQQLDELQRAMKKAKAAAEAEAISQQEQLEAERAQHARELDRVKREQAEAATLREQESASLARQNQRMLAQEIKKLRGRLTDFEHQAAAVVRGAEQAAECITTRLEGLMSSDGGAEHLKLSLDEAVRQHLNREADPATGLLNEHSARLSKMLERLATAAETSIEAAASSRPLAAADGIKKEEERGFGHDDAIHDPNSTNGGSQMMTHHHHLEKTLPHDDDSQLETTDVGLDALSDLEDEGSSLTIDPSDLANGTASLI